MEKVAVERSVWIGAPHERAWRAVTDPAQLDHWYATNYRWEIPARRVGVTVKFFNPDNAVDLQVATIEVVDPPREFTLRWQPDPVQPEVTPTSFLLADEDGGTRVTISESGYEALPDEVRRQWTDATGGGYRMSMENLKAYLEGRGIPY